MGNCWKYVISFVAAWLCGGAAICLSAPVDGGLKPIYWKQTVFSIPYQINRPADADDAPVKVLLLVSRDGGVNWKTLESAEPKVKGFIYNAEEDGEYWFAVQTIDRLGRPHPTPGNVRPELHVIVDTQPPKLDVTANVDTRGELVIQCRSDDPHVARESLSVGVRPQEGQFQPLGVPNRNGSSPPSTPAVEELSYAPPLGTRYVQVRAEVSDLAGNRSVSQIEVDLLSTQQRAMAPGSSVADAGQPTTGQRVAAGERPWMPVRSSDYPSPNLGQAPHSSGLPLDPPHLAGGGSGGGAESSQPWPVDNVALAPPGSERPTGPSAPPSERASAGQIAEYEPLPPPREQATPSWSTRPASAVRGGGTGDEVATLPLTGQARSEDGSLDVRGNGSSARDGFGAAAAEEIPAGEPVRPIPGGRYGGGPYPDTGAPLVNTAWPGGDAGTEPSQQHRPTSPALQMVNSRTIAIDYELASVGPWGVSAVELWGTRDGGQTWRRYSVDDDNLSPVTATVEGEGDYGFRVVVHSAGGFAAAPPQPGEVPEVLVRVDLVRPEATIESVQQGAGNDADQILIRWTADDAELGPNPISLYFSPHPAGPWSIIAAGLPNSGSYSWRAERHLPEQLYVRLEVRDAAGNVSTFQTAQPVVVVRPRPQVRIREVRPFSGGGADR